MNKLKINKKYIIFMIVIVGFYIIFNNKDLSKDILPIDTVQYMNKDSIDYELALEKQYKLVEQYVDNIDDYVISSEEIYISESNTKYIYIGYIPIEIKTLDTYYTLIKFDSKEEKIDSIYLFNIDIRNKLDKLKFK